MTVETNFSNKKADIQLQSHANLHLNERIYERTFTSTSSIDFKFENGHALNLHLKPTKGFAQYNLGTYQVKQKSEFTAQPYGFYLKNQLNKKTVCGAGLVLKCQSGTIHHVDLTASTCLPKHQAKRVHFAPIKPLFQTWRLDF